MEKGTTGWTLGELATLLGGELEGPADLCILRPAPAASDDPNGLAFADNDDFVTLAEGRAVGALLVKKDAKKTTKPVIRVDRPRETFGRLLAMAVRPLPIEPGIHPLASVSPLAQVDPTACVGPYAVVERGAVVGAGSRIYPFAYVGEDCKLGAKVVLYPHATLYQDVTLGDGTIIHAGAVLGADGFGYVWTGKTQMKVPQVGGVTLGADVEVGALTAIDRATAGNTTVGDDTKLDNLVQIGHNCNVGAHTVIASFAGISGSTNIGSRVTIAGQAATNDHVNICDDVVLGGRTGVTKDISQPGVYWGLPASPIKETMRLLALGRKLPDLVDRIKVLEKKIAELESKS